VMELTHAHTHRHTHTQTHTHTLHTHTVQPARSQHHNTAAQHTVGAHDYLMTNRGPPGNKSSHWLQPRARYSGGITALVVVVVIVVIYFWVGKCFVSHKEKDTVWIMYFFIFWGSYYATRGVCVISHCKPFHNCHVTTV